jgi:hypothetical protein
LTLGCCEGRTKEKLQEEGKAADEPRSKQRNVIQATAMLCKIGLHGMLTSREIVFYLNAK